MSNKNVIDFISHLKKKQSKERLTEEILVSGWEITDDINSIDSELCIYLIDTKEPGIILFGVSLDDLPSPASKHGIDWKHFVMAWDVIADPEMPFDKTHKQMTMDMSLKALSGLDEWNNCHERISQTDNQKKAHLLVLINRENMSAPEDLIIAYSESNVLNADSVQAIINSYISS